MSIFRWIGFSLVLLTVLGLLLRFWLSVPSSATVVSSAPVVLSDIEAAPGVSALSSEKAAVPSNSPLESVQTLLHRVRQLIAKGVHDIRQHADFAMAPYSMLTSASDKRCGLLKNELDSLLQQGLFLEDTALYREHQSLCRYLIYQLVSEELGLDVGQDEFWGRLQQSDTVFKALLQQQTGQSAEQFIQAYQNYRAQRRLLLGDRLDTAWFALADELALLPWQVKVLADDSGLPQEQKREVFNGLIDQLEVDHAVVLNELIEPVELAKMALSLERESALSDDQKQVIVARFTDDAFARRYLGWHAQQQRQQRNYQNYDTERAQLVSQLSPELSARERLAELNRIDDFLIDKHNLQ